MAHGPWDGSWCQRAGRGQSEKVHQLQYPSLLLLLAKDSIFRLVHVTDERLPCFTDACRWLE